MRVKEVEEIIFSSSREYGKEYFETTVIVEYEDYTEEEIPVKGIVIYSSVDDPIVKYCNENLDPNIKSAVTKKVKKQIKDIIDRRPVI